LLVRKQAEIMRLRYGAGKPDGNQAEIVQYVRNQGAIVIILSGFPGVLDLLVYLNERLSWWEVKQPGHEQDLTDVERKIFTECPGATFVVSSIKTAEIILRSYHKMRI